MPDGSWKPDPTGRHEQRYWNGSRWTEHVFDGAVQSTDADLTPVAPDGTPAPPRQQQSTKTMQWTTGTWLSIGSAVGLIVGSISPWATVTSVFGTINVAGTKGDGTITLVLGIALAIFALLCAQSTASPNLTFLVMLLAAIAAVASLYDLSNVADFASSADSQYADASVGWGLILCAVSGGVGILGGLIRRIELTRGAGPEVATASE